ncbi:unnamed protein product [Cyclocybe aegerita]|uniref:Uncharacterized protein n=1 Tax=Cyclocybe aegerita TaxID=1973307 RepID=A0A8S0VVY7_CYCAE|nr:unnamed protein product [Cyclocybe aegerita]
MQMTSHFKPKRLQNGLLALGVYYSLHRSSLERAGLIGGPSTSTTPFLTPYHIFRLHGNPRMLKNLRIITLADLPPLVNGDENQGLLSLSLPDARPTSVEVDSLMLSSIGINWEHVTSVNLGDLQVEECLRLIHHAPQLCDCHIDKLSPCSEDVPVLAEHIVQGYLQSLEIEESRSS